MRFTACCTLWLLVSLGGCIAEDPHDTSPIDRVPALAWPHGQELTYTFMPRVSGYVEVYLHLNFKDEGDKVLRYNYEHPDRSDMDATVTYTLGPDGSIQSSEFPCEPVLFHEANHGCNADRGGYSSNEGHRSALFGVPLLAGMPIPESGTLTRMVTLGTIMVTASFNVDYKSGALLITAADDFTRGLAAYPQSGVDAFSCSIFNGEVTVSVTTGTVQSCEIVENDGPEPERYGWHLITETFPDANWTGFVSDPPLPSPGTGHEPMMPGRSKDSLLPFGFWEALDHAAQRDADVASFLSSPHIWVGHAGLALVSSSSTGSCPACLATEDWQWNIFIHGLEASLSLQMRKSFTQCVGIIDENFSSEWVEGRSAPAISSSVVAGPGLVWEEAQEATGVSPDLLALYSPSPSSRLAELYEPYFIVGFPFERGMGLGPATWHRADGTIEVFQAAGAAERSTTDNCIL